MKKSHGGPPKPINFFQSPYLDPKRLNQRTRRTQKMFGLPPQHAKRPVLSVTPTDVVRHFAKQFRSDEKGIHQMIFTLKNNVQLVIEKPNIAKAHYGLQTAHDIFATRKIPVSRPLRKREPAWGCHALCVALCACLAAKKIPYQYVRTVYRWETNTESNSHSLVLFRLGNKTFIADPFESPKPIQQVGQELREKIEALKRSRRWVQGNSPEQIGIHSFADFNLHNPDAQKE